MFKNNHPNYFYTSEGVRLFYNTNVAPETIDPQRPTIVFIYGLLCSNYHFKYQIPFFEELGYQILIHDYRFHFASHNEGPLEDCNFPAICKDLHELLEHLKIEQALFIGHSMGVNICLEHARLYPKDIDAQVLISGTVLPPQDIMFDSNVVDITMPFIQALSEQFPELYQAIWKHSYKNPIAQYAIFDGGFNKKHSDLEFVQLYMKKISELPEKLFFHLLQLMHDHDIINDLELIETPTLVMGGSRDKIIPNHVQQILNKHLKNSALYIVKDGSHVPQVDFPEMINERILLFIKKYFKQSN